MTDIVERLRKHPYRPLVDHGHGDVRDELDPDIAEAADEIERLQAAADIAELQAEIKRLRAETNKMAFARQCHEAEIERLQILARKLVKRNGDADAVCNSYANENQKFYDEIKRLRKELSYHVHTDEDIKVQNTEIERLRAELDEWRHCARYDPLMSGRQFKGWDRSQMDRCRKQFLEDKP